MLRLNEISEQRSLYSSVDDIVYALDSDSEFDELCETSNNDKIKICHSKNNLAGFELDLAIPGLQQEQLTPPDCVSVARLW